MSNIIQSKSSLYSDFRSGTLLDFTGSNDGSFVDAPVFNKEGLRLDGTDDAIDFGATGLTIKTIAILLKPSTTSEDIADLDGGTHTIEVGAGTITATGFSSPTIYVNGLASSTLTAGTRQLITITTATGISASAFKAGQETTFFDGTISAVFTSADALTASEVSELYGELENTTWPTKATSAKKDTRPDELTDGDIEASGTTAWTAGNSATLSKQTSDLGFGSKQCLRVTYNGTSNPNAYQGICTVGKSYLVKGYARGDGTNSPRVYNGAAIWNGTSSTGWQYFEEQFTAASANTLFYSIGNAGYCEFDNVQVIDLQKHYSPTVSHTDWGAYESVANETVGFISNTPFTIDSGTWKISTDTISGKNVKVIECVAAGILYIPTSIFQQTPTEAAYGTWEFYVYKADASTMNVVICGQANNAITAGDYLFEYDASENLAIVEQGTGDVISGSTAAAATWHKVKITRTTAGAFDLIVNNISEGTGSDATLTTSSYILLDIDAGDKIAYGDLKGNYSIVKKLGV